MNADDIIGSKQGRVTICKLVTRGLHGGLYGSTFKIRCDCGAKRIVNGDTLRRLQYCSRSCPLQNRVGATPTHGHTVGGRANWHPMYCRWLSMKSRCYNPNFPKYRRYGARGIQVCAKWRRSFQAYIDDIARICGPQPSSRHTIDRKNNDGNYSPRNVRWATPKQQRANQSPRIK